MAFSPASPQTSYARKALLRRDTSFLYSTSVGGLVKENSTGDAVKAEVRRPCTHRPGVTTGNSGAFVPEPVDLKDDFEGKMRFQFPINERRKPQPQET